MIDIIKLEITHELYKAIKWFAEYMNYKIIGIYLNNRLIPCVEYTDRKDDILSYPLIDVFTDWKEYIGYE